MRAILTALALCLALPASAEIARDGWASHDTAKDYATLIADVKAAAKANRFGVVTEAGPTEVAKSRGVEIPGNRVIGLFNNVYAVRVLGLSEAAMIEAPIRMYVTENPDGTATLSYKTPTMVFAPYADEGGAELMEVAAELDAAFDAIARGAVQ